MGLKFARTEKKTHFAQLHKLLYGYPKTGKTTLTAKQKVGDKEPLFIATEDGHHELGVICERVNNWQEFVNTVIYIKENEEEVKEKFSCIVIDLVADLSDFCVDDVCTKLKIKDLGDLEWGAGFRAHTKEFKRVVNHLFAILPVTFITHAKVKDIEENGVVKKEVITPEMTKGVYKYINGKCDVIGFISPANKKQPKPVLTFVPSDRLQVGSRLPLITKNYVIDVENMNTTYEQIEKDMVA